MVESTFRAESESWREMHTYLHSLVQGVVVQRFFFSHMEEEFVSDSKKCSPFGEGRLVRTLQLKVDCVVG